MAEAHTDENLADPKVDEPPESIEEELGAIFDKANAEEVEPPEEAPSKDRGSDGKFVAQDAAEESAEPVEEIADQGAEADAEAEEVQALDAPASWSAAAKEVWPNLDPVLQQEVLKREADWQTADGERANKLKGYEPIEAALEPVRSQLALNGLDEATYVRQLVAADQYLSQDPAAAIQWLAQARGVDLSQFTQAESDVDPVVAPLVNEISTLKSQVQGFIRGQQQTEAQRLNDEVQKFGVDKPYFEEVRPHMAALISSGAAADLQTAYDNAIWANPEVRAKVMAEQSAEAEAKRKEDAAAKAAKAKRVSETNLSSKGSSGGQTPAQYDSEEAELSAIYDQVQGAA